jgi:hypothetical protein
MGCWWLVDYWWWVVVDVFFESGHSMNINVWFIKGMGNWVDGKALVE